MGGGIGSTITSVAAAGFSTVSGVLVGNGGGRGMGGMTVGIREVVLGGGVLAVALGGVGA